MKFHRICKILFMFMVVMLLTACGASKEIIDYGDEAAFETALNNGENLEGKTVQITVGDINPATISGYDIYAGEHLNFVSSRHPDVEVGDTIVVRATTIESALGSWIIQYEKVENAVVGEKTIFSDLTITADSMSGTYVGKNGSVLILREDGSSEYYYMKSDEIEDDPDNIWSYADGTLMWIYDGTEVSGIVADDKTFTFGAESELDWTREDFFKVSDDSTDKTASECWQILRDAINRAEIDNFDSGICLPYSIGGVTFQIPFYWWDGRLGIGQFVAEYNASENCFAMLLFDDFDLKITDEAFEVKAVDLCNSALENFNAENKNISEAPTIVYINGLIGVHGKSTGIVDGMSVTYNVTMINNHATGTVIGLALAESDQTIFQYGADFEKIINSITVDNTSANDKSGSSNKIPTKNTSDDVSPELKEFLNNYEDFMDEYVVFMKKYQTSTNPSAMLMDYMDFMQKYSEFMEKADAYDTDEMSAVDAAYYLEVTNRIMQKLLQASP